MPTAVVRCAYKGTCVTGSGTRAEAAEASAARQLATAFPVVVAVSVAFLYSLGAIELVGQLKEEHVDALAALPLVPLQQVLGRGIWVVTHELWWILAVSIAGALGTEGVDRVESSRTRFGIKTIYVLVGCAVVIWTPLLGLFRWLFTIGLTLIAALAFRNRLRLPFAFRELMGLAAVFAVVYTVSGAFLTPDHLPIAKLQLRNGSTRGVLVAFDGAMWYLGESGRIGAVPNQNVLSSRIERVPHRHDKSLWRLMF
jgi:hypothetical protein